MIPKEDASSQYSRYTNTNKKSRFAPDSSMDDGVLDNLSSILSTLEQEGNLKDYEPLIGVFRKGFVVQAVQSWSYYAQVNNLPKFVSSTKILATTLRMAGSHELVNEYGSNLVNIILKDQITVLYRGLNNMRASITNAIISLMREIILFNSGQHVEEMVYGFDFSLPSLSKILNINKSDIPILETTNMNPKLSMRHELIEFWLQLISLCSPFLRKDLLTENSRMVGNWFKFMDKVDSASLVKYTLNVLIEKILKEPVFKRMTKTKILNELALSKIHSFYNSSDKELVKIVNQFFLTYGSDPKTSVAFPDDCVWFSESPLNGTRKGVVVAINQKEFQVYNKLLFNVLKFFKPWEDEMQSATVSKILDHVPELIPPYCSFLASHGSHDPKMTSYWFGCTMMIGRIIRLKIPSFMEQIQTDISPSTGLVIQSIIPSSLTKSALTKALTHEKLLIRQLACQLIVFSFQKLDSILQLYEQKGWIAAKASLRNAFHLEIPDLSAITQVLNDVYASKKENRVLQLSLTTILKYYSKLFPNFFSVTLSSSNIYVDIMRNVKFSGMDLAILDNYLQFQELNGTQLKWWNSTTDDHSLFVSLLSLTVKSNSSIQEKICQLLENLFRGTVAFNELSCSPQKVLIHSLQFFSGEEAHDEMTKIWKLLNETIERSMRTPYKYVDSSREHSFVSPFTMALVEQWKYVDKSTSFTLAAKWICIYMRTMVMCGESRQGMLKVAQTMLHEIPEKYIKYYLGFENYEDTLKELQNDDYLLSRMSESSFFEYISLAPYSSLKKFSRYPIHRFDAVGLQFRLFTLVNQHDIVFNNYFEEVVDVFMMQLANYSMADRSFKFMNTKLAEVIFDNIAHLQIDDSIFLKSLIVASEMLKINNDLLGDGAFQTFTYKWLQKNKKFLKHEDKCTAKFISLICQSLSAEASLSLLDSCDQINVKFLKDVLTTLLGVGRQCVSFKILMTLLDNSCAESLEIANQIIRKNLVFEMDNEALFNLALKDKRFSSVVESFLHSNYYSMETMLPYLPSITEEDILLTIALMIQDSENEIIDDFVKRAIKSCLSLFKNMNIESSQKALQLFSIKPDLISENEKTQIVDYILKEYSGKYSASVIEFLITVGHFENPDVLKWLGKLALFITREFAHSETLSNGLSCILLQMQDLIKVVNLWEKVSPSILNAQLEVMLSGSHVNNDEVLEYICHVLLSGNSKAIECGKVVQCFLNNERNILGFRRGSDRSKFLSSIILLVLFQLNPSKCSNEAAQRKILKFYSGTIAGHDRIILKTLEIIEAKTYLSWTNDVFMWDLIEAGGEEDLEAVDLMSRKKEGLIVTLKAELIENTVRNYVLNKPELPVLVPSDVGHSWEVVKSFMRKSERAVSKIEGPLYDPLFLLLVTLHNEELVKKAATEDGSVKYTFNVKGLLACKIFQVTICALADEPLIHDIALSIIVGMLTSLEEKDQLKDDNVFKVLLKRILFTFRKKSLGDEEETHIISPCIWSAISALCDNLLNPASPLYEKSYRWVFSSPFVRYNDFPLLQELMLVTKSQTAELEHYYKQLGWVLDNLNRGLKTVSDVELLKKKGVLEWLSNLMNMPYLNARLRSSINSIFFLAQRLENSGSTLITRVASISNLEMHSISLEKKIQEATQENSESLQKTKLIKKTLNLEEEQLNLKQILKGHTVLLKSQKRLREWVGEDSNNIQKRLRL